MMTLGVLTNGSGSKVGIGWLYLDHYGDRFVLLKKSADDEAYDKFRMQRDALPNRFEKVSGDIQDIDDLVSGERGIILALGPNAA